MKIITYTTVLLTLFAFSLKAQIRDSIKTSVDSVLNKVEQTLIEYEENLDITASKTILTAEEIRERGYDNLDELISSVQGMYITHDRTFTQIGIRGISPTELNNQRVLILLDNIPLNNPLSGQAPSGYELRGIPMENIEEVIFIRAPSAILYGNSAMLGVIKIKTKMLKKGVRVNFDRGSFGQLDGGLSVGKAWQETSFSLSGNFGFLNGQNLYIPEFEHYIEHSDERNYGGLQLQLKHRKFALKASYNQSISKIVTAPDSSLILDERGFVEGKHFFADVSYEGSVKKNQSVYAHLFVNYDQQEKVLHFELGDDADESRQQKTSWAGLEYQHLFHLDSSHHLLLGTEFWYIPTANYISEGAFGSGDNLDFSDWRFSVLAHDSYQLNEHFTINGGLRLDFNAQTKPIVGPQVAIAYTPTEKTTLRFGYSKGYRLPSLLETDIAQILYPLPNKNLIPETINSLEFALKQQIGNDLNLNVVLYHQQLHDIIDNDLNVGQYANLLTLKTNGLEFGLSVDLPEGIKTYLYYNFQFDNKAKVNMPSPLCKFGVTIPFLKHFTLFAEGQYEGSRLTLDGLYTLPYFLMNSNLILRPKINEAKKSAKWLNQSSISFRVYNVLDQFYQHPSGQQLTTQFISQNGRTWQTKLALQF